MKPGPNISIAIVLLAAGLWLGRAVGGRTSPVAGEQETLERAERSPRRTASVGSAAHDVKELRQRLARAQLDPGGHSRELARLGVPVLQELILKAAEVPESETQEEKSRRSDLLRAAVAELYQRVGMGALEWAAALATGDARRDILGMALDAAAADDPVTALPWVERFAKDYGDGGTYRFLITALLSAKTCGAEEMLRVYQSLGKGPDGRFVRLGLGGYAEGFDFGALYRGLPEDIAVHGMVNFWAGRDPEAAWQAVAADPGDKRRKDALKGVVEGAIANMGEAAGMEWALSRLEQVPEDLRGDAVKSLATAIHDNEVLVATAGKLAGEQRSAFAGEIYNGEADRETKMAVLASLPRGELLEVMARKDRLMQMRFSPKRDISISTRRRFESERERYQASLAETAGRFSLTPQEMARIREKQK